MSQADSTLIEYQLIEQAGELPLRQLVNAALEQYFSNLDGEQPSNLYELVLEEVETALMRTVMQYTTSNQSQAAKLLGISRNTLRKKLAQYCID